MSYRVKEVADMVGVSVRTLHHYHNIGLLEPQFMSVSGYRLYSDENLEKLQQILFFKELDFNLQKIKDVLNSPSFDRKNALKIHKKLLIEKKKRLERIIKSVDKTIDDIEGECKMNKKDMFESFDMSQIEEHRKKYADETKEKYGDSLAYKESMKKTSKYTKEDWKEITKTGDEIYKKIANNMEKGSKDLEVQKAVGEFRKYITDNFYNCTPEIFRGLGELYVSDERFTANIDKHKTGLAKFLKEAMNYYCDNLKL